MSMDVRVKLDIARITLSKCLLALEHCHQEMQLEILI